MSLQKTNYVRSKKLTELARGELCTLMLHHDGGHPRETTVWAHSNESRHGKGKGIKSHDCFGAFACFHCHSILDQGWMTRNDKLNAMRNAMRITRFRLFAKKMLTVAEGVDIDRATNDENYWLECWQDGRIRA